jgi:hypothetical protein
MLDTGCWVMAFGVWPLVSFGRIIQAQGSKLEE